MTDSQRTASRNDVQQPNHPFPVVGIGTAEGGLDALARFFQALPPDNGMAFVVIMRAGKPDDTTAAIRAHTTLPVVAVDAPTHITPNQVYVIPADQRVVMEDGIVRLDVWEHPEEQFAPINLLFRTLATAHDGHTAGIVLGGDGADGAMGLQRIKEHGGIALAQEPGEATHNTMPHNAIATGLVDWVLPVGKMPATLMHYWRQAVKITPPAAPVVLDEGLLHEVFAVLHVHTGHDFTRYKRSTITRRLLRRMQVTNAPDLAAYLAILRGHDTEVQALLRDFLISVTNFFRDREVWDTLATIVPALFRDKGADDQVRVWVAGCATGEEAYSVAMLLHEHSLTLADRPAIQVFATDIDDDALQAARQGVYLETIAADITPARLERYFVHEASHYRVKKELRDLVLFAPQNLLRDPPFSRLDLITCRNLLIYLNREVQGQIMQIFHFTLRLHGYLLLGVSESTDGMPELWTSINKQAHLFQRRASPSAIPVLGPGGLRSGTAQPVPAVSARVLGGTGQVWTALHQQLLLEHTPPGVIVGPGYDIVHVARGAGRWLQWGNGAPSQNLLDIVDPALRLELRTLLFQVQHGETTETWPVSVMVDGTRRLVRVVVQAITEPDWARGALLVLFNDLGVVPAAVALPASDAEPLVRQLEAELARTRDQLRITSEQYETTAEEYRAANEELQAINEELRAASEELETSKEELQSLNEELTTLNQALKHKVDEATQAHSDLQNSMAATEIGTVFVDHDLRIKRYTPSAQALFNFIVGDLNRPLSDITHRLQYRELGNDAARVRDTQQPIDREVRGLDGHWYLARILPYHTLDGLPSGAVLTFVDITARVTAQTRLRASEERLRLLIESAKDYAIFTLDPERRVTSWSAGAQAMFGYEEREIEGRSGDVLFTPEDRAHAAPQGEVAKAATEGRAENERWHTRKHGAYFYASGTVRPLRDERGELLGFVKIMRDLTEQQQAEEALRESEERFRAIVNQATAGVSEMDATGTFTLVNKRFCTLLGYTADELLGMTMQALTHPDDLAGCVTLFERAVATGTPFVNEKRYVHRNGATMWVNDSVSIIKDAAGETLSVVAVVIDISERKAAEDALRRNEAHFRALLAKGADMITISAPSGEIVYASPSTERVSGYTADEFRGSNPFGDSIHPDDVGRCQVAMDALIATPGLSVELQHRARHKNGEWRWYEGTFTSLFHDSAVGGLVANVRDITERKQAEVERERLLAAERAARADAEAALDIRDQFLGIASHELRTPLTALTGYAAMLQQNMASDAVDATKQRMAAMIVRQAERLNALTTELLDVSRLQRGQFALNRQPLDWTALVERIVDDVHLTLPMSGAPYQLDLRRPTTPIRVLGDASRLEEVVQNLLSNAVKYSPNGGTIRVQLTVNDGEATLEVADQGIGIPLAAQARLWEPFFRAGNVGSRTSGFGIGLYVVHEIITRHGGRIEVDSAEGQGSTFRVVVPTME